MSEYEDVSITQDIIKQWLSEKRCTLWQQWDIVSSDGMNEASKWMLEQIISVIAFAQNYNELVL